MAQEVLFSLSIIIAISALITLIARAIKQPPIIAYLIAGIIVGPLVFGLIGPETEQSGMLQAFAHIGVAFLLFIVGLSLDFRVLKDLGKVATSAGFIEIIATGGIGMLIALGLGFSNLSALYIGAALAFSSTVVVVKILADKKEIDTLHGKLALGILIVEDLVAAIALMAVPLIESGGSTIEILQKLGLIIIMIAFIFMVTAIMHKKLLDYLARSQETLFLFGIAWALVLATLFDKLGFSLEIGALIAGMSLASSKYTLELGGKMKPLRDFFMVLFFVFFGSQLTEAVSYEILKQALIFSIFIIIGKPLIVMTAIRFFGYTKKTNFLASSSLAQISEFSLILTLLGFTLGHISQDIMSLMILVSLITIGTSSYNIYYANRIFNKISLFLSIFESKKMKNQLRKYNERQYDVLIFGSHRLGSRIIQALKEMKISFAVVDYNPRAILSLNLQRTEAIFGDGGDRDFLSELPLNKAKLIISTIPDEESNIAIKETLENQGSQAIFIATAEQSPAAIDLYKQGIDYVIIPHHLGGDLMSTIIRSFKIDKNKYRKLGQDHLKNLEKGKEKSYYSNL